MTLNGITGITAGVGLDPVVGSVVANPNPTQERLTITGLGVTVAR